MNKTESETLRPWTGRMVWDGQKLQHTDNWIIQLTERDVAELKTAVINVKQTAKTLDLLTEKDFPFEHFGERLLALREDLAQGRGFSLIRGLSGDEWDDEMLMTAYWGIGTWLGNAVPQNADAHLLGHVIDKREDHATGTRVYQTNQAQPFHSDSCDLVGLLCLRIAKKGGASAVASSAAIFNDLLKHDKAALHILQGVFHCDRYGEIPAGKKPSYPVNVFNNIEGQIVCCGMDPDIRSAQRLDEVPSLSSVQRQALDRFQESATKLALKMNLKRGDMQFVNNLVAVHARTGFEDHLEPDLRRYLVRLWLSSPDGRQLPEFLQERWGNIKPGTIRGGIRVPGAIPSVRLKPW